MVSYETVFETCYLSQREISTHLLIMRIQNHLA